MEEKRKELIRMQANKHCNLKIYEEALDMCKEIEYAISELDKIK